MRCLRPPLLDFSYWSFRSSKVVRKRLDRYIPDVQRIKCVRKHRYSIVASDERPRDVSDSLQRLVGVLCYIIFSVAMVNNRAITGNTGDF